MKQYINIKTLLITLVLVSFTACDSLLDTEPTTSASPEMLLKEKSGVNALLTSAYDRLRSDNLYRYYLMAAPEILADNAQKHPIDSGRFTGQAINEYGSHFTSSVWSTSYRIINEANILIDGVDKVEDASQDEKDRIKGEALFLRALAYQNLLKVYSYEPNHPMISEWDQGVIIRTSPVLGKSQADLRARESVLDGYKRVEQDYLDALDLIKSNDRGNVYYATEAAVYGGLARLYLYWEKWDEALEYAEYAEADSKGSLTDYVGAGNVYEQMPHPESIFELKFDVLHGSSGSLNALTNPPPGWFDMLPSDEVIALYDNNDARLTNLFSTYTDDNGTHNYLMKYPASVGNNTDNIPVMRVPEMLLIQAEAHYELTNESDAIKALNKIRAKRGINDLNSNISGTDLLDEIMDERRRELVFEGHRWFDLKRRAMDVPKASVTALSPVKYDDIRILAPLSGTQVENNDKLDNNPGY